MYSLESSPENWKKKERKHTDAAVVIHCVMDILLYYQRYIIVLSTVNLPACDCFICINCRFTGMRNVVWNRLAGWGGGIVLPKVLFDCGICMLWEWESLKMFRSNELQDTTSTNNIPMNFLDTRRVFWLRGIQIFLVLLYWLCCLCQGRALHSS
jgi:hypothetical protein